MNFSTLQSWRRMPSKLVGSPSPRKPLNIDTNERLDLRSKSTIQARGRNGPMAQSNTSRTQRGFASPFEPNPQYTGPPLFTDLTNQRILEDIEERLAGDAVFANREEANARVLRPDNPNHFFVSKTDFNAPTTYQLSLIKPFPRTKIKAFLPAQGQNGTTLNSKLKMNSNLQKVQEKFFSGANVVSSQYKNPQASKPGNKPVDQSLPDLSREYDANHQKQFTKLNKDNFWNRRGATTPRYEGT